MKTQVENGCKDEFGRAEWVNFFSETEEVRSVRVTNRSEDKIFGCDLSGFAVVRLDAAAELLFTANVQRTRPMNWGRKVLSRTSLPIPIPRCGRTVL